MHFTKQREVSTDSSTVRLFVSGIYKYPQTVPTAHRPPKMKPVLPPRLASFGVTLDTAYVAQYAVHRNVDMREHIQVRDDDVHDHAA